MGKIIDYKRTCNGKEVTITKTVMPVRPTPQNPTGDTVTVIVCNQADYCPKKNCNGIHLI